MTSVVGRVEKQQETIGFVNSNSDSDGDSDSESESDSDSDSDSDGECDVCGGAIWG